MDDTFRVEDAHCFESLLGRMEDLSCFESAARLDVLRDRQSVDILEDHVIGAVWQRREIVESREILGAGSITVWGDLKFQIGGMEPMVLMILAPGGFIALGVLLGLMNHLQARLAALKGETYEPPPHLDCRHCVICKFGA